VLNPAASGGTRFLLLTVAFDMRTAALAAQLKTRDAEVRDVACALLDLRAGTFTFAPAATLALAPRFGIEALLVEAARRADEWGRLAAWVPGPTSVPVLIVGEGPADTSSGAPTPRQWTLLAEVDGSRDVAALATAVGRDALAVAADCAALVRAGLLRCDDAGAPSGG